MWKIKASHPFFDLQGKAATQASLRAWVKGSKSSRLRIGIFLPQEAPIFSPLFVLGWRMKVENVKGLALKRPFWHYHTEHFPFWFNCLCFLLELIVCILFPSIPDLNLWSSLDWCTSPVLPWCITSEKRSTWYPCWITAGNCLVEHAQAVVPVSATSKWW